MVRTCKHHTENTNMRIPAQRGDIKTPAPEIYNVGKNKKKYDDEGQTSINA